MSAAATAAAASSDLTTTAGGGVRRGEASAPVLIITRKLIWRNATRAKEKEKIKKSGSAGGTGPSRFPSWNERGVHAVCTRAR
jgi:hypothetical protein